MFRFATGTGQRVQWRLVREFDHHLLKPCLALWQRALAFVSLLALARCLRPVPVARHRALRLHSCVLLLPSEFAQGWLRDAAEAAAPANPRPAAALPATPSGPLLVIARRRGAGAFMHAREGEVGRCHCGRR